MSHEFIDSASDHVGIVAILEDSDVFLGSEDAEVFGDEGTRIELSESGSVEAEGSDRIGNRLQDLYIVRSNDSVKQSRSLSKGNSIHR